MPLTDSALRALWREGIRVVWRGVESELETLWTDTKTAVVKLVLAFPNVKEMADIITRWATSLLGRLITAPITGLEATIVMYLTRASLHNRLIRVDDAVRLMFEGPRSFIRFITLTEEAGIISYLAQRFGIWLYHTVKSVKLLSRLIRAASAEEFAATLVSSWLSKGVKFIWVAVFVAIFVALAAECAWLLALLFGFGFLSGKAQLLILPQDSKRVWRKRGGVARRNTRKGKDEPDT